MIERDQGSDQSGSFDSQRPKAEWGLTPDGRLVLSHHFATKEGPPKVVNVLMGHVSTGSLRSLVEKEQQPDQSNQTTDPKPALRTE